MALKRKISVRKILQLFVTLVVTSCCITAMIGASKIEDNKEIKKIAVHIKNDKKYHFIEQQEILDLAIGRQQTDLEHTPISNLDIHGMEQVIMADPWVANAQVYVDNECVLQMYVTQRIPVARVFDKNSRSFYLDTTLSIMPVSRNYTYYTTVITNMPDLVNDSISWSVRKDVITIVRKLQSDAFWNAQVSEIVVDTPGMYELVPILGNQRIIVGDVTRLNDKLDNLFAFYKNVLNRIGWDKYETLDLRFAGQVVATPSLPYKGPTDKAVVNMNWINSILETEAKKDALNDAKDSAKAAVTQTLQPKPKPVKNTVPQKVAPKGKYLLAAGTKKVTKQVMKKAAKNDKKGVKKAAVPVIGNKAKQTSDKNKKQSTDKKIQKDKKEH